MIIYSVTITLAAEVEAEWLAWMQQVHVPDVLGTGCFTECRTYRVAGTEEPEVSYVLQYHCPSLAQYQHYRENFAPALQKEHTARYAGRFRGSRQVLEEISRIQPG
jgi:hypothetical protein